MSQQFNLTGRQLGNYRLIALLGEGGMGSVYRALQVNLDREVAVKVLPHGLAAKADFVARFEREAKTVAQLDQHDNIISIIDFGTEGNISYVVMPYLTGGSLADRLKTGEAYNANQIANLLDQLASALEFAHSRGIVHRDIKPDNILFNQFDTPFIADFGIAKMLGDDFTSLTQSGMAVGTPKYMAPEQWRGQTISPATDQYALAVVIYQLVVGDLPFAGSTPQALMYKHIESPPPPPHTRRPDVPAAVSEVLLRALNKTAQERFPSMQVFANAFRAAISGQVQSFEGRTARATAFEGVSDITAPTASAIAAPSTSTRRNLLRFGIPLVVIIALAVILVILLMGNGNDNGANESAERRNTTSTTAQTEVAAASTESLSATPSEPLTATASATTEPLDTLIARANTNDTATANYEATEIASSATATSTTDVAATVNFLRTQTATLWTPTPSATNTATATATPTPSPTVTLTPTITQTPTVAVASERFGDLVTLPPYPRQPYSEELPHLLIYTIQAGETLRSIAQEFNSSVEAILSYSTLSQGDFLYIGQVLYIPVSEFNGFDPRLALTPVTDSVTWTPITAMIGDSVMALVPPGCFPMGSVEGRPNEQPVHEQCIDEAYWIDVVEVSNARYGEVSDLCARWSSEPNQPRLCVSWFDAKDFCEARGGRLPREPEWEYAASGPNDYTYPWGNRFIPEYAVYIDTPELGDTRPALVGSIPANASWVGAYDMVGNSAEWLSTRFEEDISYPYDPNDGRENQEIRGIRRGLRGGGFVSDDFFLTTTFRSAILDDTDGLSSGFRCVRDLD